MTKTKKFRIIREGECPGEPEQHTIVNAIFDDDRVFEFDSPESSTVIHADYDYRTRRLVVQFKGGARYRYTIEEEMWQEFATAESKGGYFAARIRPFFLGEKL